MTSIEWADETWNPVTGCSKVSPGCAHCYAETQAAFRAGRPGWIEEHRPWTPQNAEHNVRLWPARLDKPLHWRKPRMVFVNSMSDLFHEQIPDDYIARVFAVMNAARAHTFQVLTKRPERMQPLLTTDAFWVLVDEWSSRRWNGESRIVGEPLRNVWLGVSIENRRFVDRADLLRETPAAVRFISAEPLLGPLLYDWWGNVPDPPYARAGRGTAADDACWYDGYDGPELDLDGIDWLIVGGESGPHHRPMNPRWVRDLRDACVRACSCSTLTLEGGAEHVHRPAFFFKQWGGRTPKAGGRELDGRTWDEMPSPQQPVGGHEDQQDEEKVSAHGHDYPTLAENRVGTAPR